MARCQYCKKLTHSEDVNVYFDISDIEKIQELQSLEKWSPAYMQMNSPPRTLLGTLKCGDIYVNFHFMEKKNEMDN